MPHRTRPLTALLVFLGVNVALVSTITPVYDFVCFHPYWERRRQTTSIFIGAHVSTFAGIWKSRKYKRIILPINRDPQPRQKPEGLWNLFISSFNFTTAIFLCGLWMLYILPLASMFRPQIRERHRKEREAAAGKNFG